MSVNSDATKLTITGIEPDITTVVIDGVTYDIRDYDGTLASIGAGITVSNVNVFFDIPPTVFDSTISFDITAPTFSVTAEPVAIPGNDAVISFSIAEPTFNVHAGTDQDIYYYGRGTQLKLIIKSRELRI